MKKIVYFHQYFVTPQNSGGTRSWEFCKRLLKEGWNIKMVSSDSFLQGINQEDIVNSYGDTNGNFEIDIIPISYSNKTNYLKRMFVYAKFMLISLRQAILEPAVDIVYATSTPLTIAAPALLRKWVRGTPYIFEVRDLWPELPVAMGAIKSPFLIRIAEWIESAAYHNAHHLVALSPGMKEGIVSKGIDEDKVTVITNSCDNDRFKVSEDSGRQFIQNHPEFSQGPLIVYIGTLGRINGVSYLVKLAKASQKLMPNANFLIVGSGACENSVKELALSLGVLNNNLWMWSPVPKAEVPAILSAATIATSLFIPIKEMEHNSANKFFDSLAAGKPVAINYGGWQRELLESSGAGIYLDCENIDKAAAQLSALVMNQEGTKLAGEKARELSEEVFSRDIAYQKLRKILFSV